MIYKILIFFAFSFSFIVLHAQSMDKIPVIDTAALKQCLGHKGANVCLIRLDHVTCYYKGTRGERFHVTGRVLHTLSGNISGAIAAWSWGRVPAGFTTGCHYIVALDSNIEDSKVFLLCGWAPVPEGKENDAIELHRQLIHIIQTELPPL